MARRGSAEHRDATRTLAHGYFEYLSLFEQSLHLPAAAPHVTFGLPGAFEPLPANLDVLNAAICDCVRCALGATRTKFVFGVGNPAARIVLVGEAPGRDEDVQGIPFVGRAGQLLDQLLAEIGLQRGDVYICNVLKCRPPNNRDPEPQEVETCRPHLLTQLSLIRPELVVCLGRHAAAALLGTEAPMRELRGRVLPWHGMQVLVTYHPAYYLRNSSQFTSGRQDFALLRRLYDEESG